MLDVTKRTAPFDTARLDRLQTWLFGERRGPVEQAEEPVHAVAAE